MSNALGARIAPGAILAPAPAPAEGDVLTGHKTTAAASAGAAYAVSLAASRCSPVPDAPLAVRAFPRSSERSAPIAAKGIPA